MPTKKSIAQPPGRAVEALLSFKALELVLVETEGRGYELVSLSLGILFAGGEEMYVDGTIPVFYVDEEIERAAAKYCGVKYDGQLALEHLIPYIRRTLLVEANRRRLLDVVCRPTTGRRPSRRAGGAARPVVRGGAAGSRPKSPDAQEADGERQADPSPPRPA